jgi:short-subunit dehydrogenase
MIRLRDKMDFKNKVVLISGATGGMGEEIAKLLSKEGCHLALFARREEKLAEISKKLSEHKTQCVYKKCDVKNKDDIRDAVAFTYTQYERIDIVILIAGILVPNPVQRFDSSLIKETMDVNFMSDIYFLEYLLPIMKKQRSGIIAAVSTLPDKRGVAGWGAYGASKAALSLFMESLRAEIQQRYGISIITIKPGSVETPMIEGKHRPGALQPEDAAKIIINGIRKRKKVIEFPLMQVLLTKMENLLPVWMYDKIPIHMQKAEGYPTVEEEYELKV